MQKELELWQFVAARLKNGESVMLLVVANSSGSSPGRAGYKIAVAADGELIGSIGGGVMEVRLVEQARRILEEERRRKGDEEIFASVVDQVHRKDAPNSSGMICSGEQTVIFRLLTFENATNVDAIIKALEARTAAFLKISSNGLNVVPPEGGTPNADFHFEKLSETDFHYCEKLGYKNALFIIGGGHCALALSELMSRMDFRISIFDDRPDLNTIDKNRFAHEKNTIQSYEKVGEAIPSGPNIYVVVMTLGYKSDEIVIRGLIDKDFKYFGVLGSKAKMKTLLSSLRKEGFPKERLAQIHTPIGLPINSRTPEEIAVSIAAEIIAIKNS